MCVCVCVVAYLEADPARDDDNFARLDNEEAHLGAEVEGAVCVCVCVCVCMI